uniref:ATP synthase complex subunit 8 n=1 Tax=Neotermes sp. 1 AB-2022a TaxID=2942739 RepID=A0A8X8M205_9NEOP|nr:ATP synthase F0 subunit 8 [Neotermes sp. 1 AB-2022a]
MPQMMPMSWLTLFIMFSMTLILFASTNYYTNITKSTLITKKVLKVKKLNWKW